MICRKTTDVQPIERKELEYQGKSFKIKHAWIRWLTHKNLGGEEYRHNHALVHFTVGPNGDIPMHNHKYVQITYVLSGRLLYSALSKNGDIEEREVEPGDFIYNYSFEPHSIRNPSSVEPAVFLSCVECVDDKQNCDPDTYSYYT